MVLATVKNWMNCGVPGVMPSEPISCVNPAWNAGAVAKTSTTVPPPTVYAPPEIRGLLATSIAPWIEPSD
jgi:hypothetical protein